MKGKHHQSPPGAFIREHIYYQRELPSTYDTLPFSIGTGILTSIIIDGCSMRSVLRSPANLNYVVRCGVRLHLDQLYEVILLGVLCYMICVKLPTSRCDKTRLDVRIVYPNTFNFYM